MSASDAPERAKALSLIDAFHAAHYDLMAIVDLLGLATSGTGSIPCSVVASIASMMARSNRIMATQAEALFHRIREAEAAESERRGAEA